MIRAKIKDELEAAKKRNSAFSMRSFSSKIGLTPSALSEVLNSKRKLSRKLAAQVLTQMKIATSERDQILAQFDKTIERKKRITLSKKKKDTGIQILTDDQFRVISDWYHFAILSLSETDHFQGTPEFLSKRLGIKTSEAEEGIERLKRLALIEIESKSGFKATDAQLRTPDHVVSEALRNAHAQNLLLARQSLEEDSIETRDFTAITMAIDPESLPEAKKLIRKFRDDLSRLLESGEKKEVYKLCVQLFPLTEIL